MKQKAKKILSILLSVMMIFTSIGFPVYADTPAPASHVIISQVYAGGGNSGAIFTHDFVELYNPTSSPVNMSGWTLQYASATNAFASGEKVFYTLTGTIQPGKYYLVQMAVGNNTTMSALPTPDEACLIAMGGTNGKVVLANSSALVTSATDTHVVDFVGYGSATMFEGTAPTPALSNSTAAIRKTEGVDTNQNSSDFIVGTPTPRNSTHGVVTKCAMPTTNVLSGMVFPDTQVTFSTATDGASIEYNTVSATHDTWTTGNTAIISESKTYYVRAVLEGIESSDIVAFNYTVDNKLTITATPDYTDAVSGATVVLTANDPNAHIFYTINKSEVTSDSPYAISITSGSSVKIEGTIGDTVSLKAYASAYGLTNREDSEIFSRDYTIKDPNDVLNIKQALALPFNTENVQVRGTIAYFVTGYNNPVIHSEIDGQMFALYIFGSAPTSAKVGDEVRFTGKLEAYGQVPQLRASTSVFIESRTPIAPLELTISEILTQGTALLNRFVKIKDVTLGTFTSSNTPVTDGTGTMNIYQATAYPVQVVEGDKVDLYAMVSGYNGSLQLRTGTISANGFNIYDITNDTKPPLVTLRDVYADAKANQDYTLAVSAADNKGIQNVKISYTIGSTSITDQLMVYNENTLEYTYTIPGTSILSTEDIFSFVVTATDVTGLSTTTDARSINIDSKPQIIQLTPNRNASTGDDKSPLIAVQFSNTGENPVVKFTLKKDSVTLVDNQTMTAGTVPESYQYATQTLVDGLYNATVTITRSDLATNTVTWNFTVGTPQFLAYFGQLHAHTAEYSDGSGTLANGLSYLKSLPTNENVQFVSFTDHSNYFDTTTASNSAAALNDKTQMTAASLEKWNRYVTSMETFNDENIGTLVAFPGFEMTWSGGPGHINTFNSDGLISRNNSALNNKTADAGMKLYYDTLIQNTDPLANLSQFNHPGATFGTFSDFGYWSPAYDNKMVAIEIGNGEGAIGSGGYFPSYTEYTKALDKGWHVAPTNNQDNHKGKWGNANTARTVIISDDLSTEGLLKGLKNMSVYATEDKNLTIAYTVNDNMMGSVIGSVPTTPLEFIVTVDDPDQDDIISKIELITNSGRVAKSETFDRNTVEWTFELPPVQGYYYVRVTQADKNIAVTAPIWIGQAPLVGISSVESNAKMPVTGETLTLSTTIFNNESSSVTLKSLEYRTASEVLSTTTPNEAIATTASIKKTLDYTPTKVGIQTITVTAIIDVNGQDKTFTQDIALNIRDSEKLVYIGIDASHNNEYVRGNYKDSMGNFANMAVAYDVRVVELETSEALIAATQNSKYQMIILTPPTRRNGSNFLIGYKNYTDEEIDAIKTFAETGKTVIVTGWSDAYENYTKYSDNVPYDLPASDQMSAQQNKLLAALGTTLRISDDEIRDDVNNGGQAQRLYLKNYNLDNPFLNGVKPLEQVYSNYGGASIYVVDANNLPTSTLSNTVSPMVYAFDQSYSQDRDTDGTTGHEGITVPKYDGKHMVAASESVEYQNGNKATIIVAGAAFMSNFEIQVELDSYATPAYSNFTILENIVQYVNPVEITPISEVHAASENVIFTIKGLVTSNASGYDRDTAFFDSIYVQDSTGGINLFPVAGDVRVGQTIQVTGVTSSYNGERQLNVQKISIEDTNIGTIPAPINVTTAQASASAHLGSLIRISGVITNLTYANDVIESIFVKDNSNGTARVFIDGYITQSKTIENLALGANITAVGLSSIDTDGARIRIRDRADIICTPATSSGNNDDPTPEPTTEQTTTTAAEVTLDERNEQVKAIVKPSDVHSQNNKTTAKASDTEIKNALAQVLNVNTKEAPALLQFAISSGENKEVAFSLSRASLTSITAVTDLSVSIKSDLGSIEINPAALNQLVSDLDGTALGDIQFVMAKLDNSAVDGNPVYDFSIYAGDQKLSNFGTGKVTVRLPYTLAMNEDPNSVVVYYVDDADELHVVRGNYDAESQSVIFETPHFSNFMISRKATTFKDVNTADWYYSAVAFATARDIASGVGSNQFAPTQNVTRGEFIVMLMKAYGITPNASDRDNFSDAGNTYYTAYLATAKKLGITKGIGNNLYAPNATLSRQDMMTMLYTALITLGELPSNTLNTQNLSLYNDHASVAQYAEQALSHFLDAGYITGYNGNLNPTGLATRAQTAQIFLNLLKLK